LVGNPEGNKVENPAVDVEIMIELIFKKQGGIVWIGLLWLRIRASNKSLITGVCRVC
jgi:hypothetical protein